MTSTVTLKRTLDETTALKILAGAERELRRRNGSVGRVATVVTPDPDADRRDCWRFDLTWEPV